MACTSLRGILRKFQLRVPALLIVCQPADTLTALVQNKLGFAAYETGERAQYPCPMRRPGMVTRTLAWLGQVIDVGFVGGTVANNYYCETAPSVLPVSRFDFSGQLREEGDIAVKFLRQTTDYCLGRHHLAVDHLEQLHRVDAQLSAQPEDIGAPSRAQSANMLAELIDLRLWHFG
jgi:hypothetical protein